MSNLMNSSTNSFMNNMTTINRLGIAVVIAVFAGSVVAAEPKSDDSTDGSAVLRGPTVVDQPMTETVNTMSGSHKKSAQKELPFRAYLGAIRGLHKAAQDNPELALTDEQKEEIKAIAEAHKEKMKAFMEEHKEQFAEIRGKHSEKRRKNGKQDQQSQQGKQGPDSECSKQNAGKKKDCKKSNDASSQSERSKKNAENRPSKEDRKKMRDLMSKAPSDQGAIAQLWAVLTPEQQEAVKANIKDMRAKRHSRVDEAMDRGRKGREGKKDRDREGESQGMIENPIFKIDEVVEMSDDC